MNFKDKAYYVDKTKNFLGLLLSAIIVDAVIMLGFLLA